MRTHPFRRRRLPVLLAGLAGLVAAHLALSAVGAFATVEDGVSVAGRTVHVVLSGGQDDRVELSMLGPGRLGIAYAGTAPPTVSAEECRLVAPRLIACDLERLSRIHVETGDGDDVVDTSRISYAVEIDTGAGDDIVYGGGGDERVMAGDGDDTISPAGGDDLVSGGEGTDVVSYLSATRTTEDNLGRDVEDVVFVPDTRLSP